MAKAPSADQGRRNTNYFKVLGNPSTGPQGGGTPISRSTAPQPAGTKLGSRTASTNRTPTGRSIAGNW